MLLPIETRGTQTPLFMMHGLLGFYQSATRLSRALGPDQPFYQIQARGFDSDAAPRDRAEDMIADYVAEIRAFRPRGPYLVGGTCSGSMLAIDLANRLAGMGEIVGPVIIIDPPTAELAQRHLSAQAQLESDPLAREKLLEGAKFQLRDIVRDREDGPYPQGDDAAFARAAEVALASIIAIHGHCPAPYRGAVSAIVSAERALQFLSPGLPWQKDVLLGRTVTHIVPGRHNEIFRDYWDETSALAAYAVRSAHDKLARGITAPELAATA